ncbi:Uncharacterized conserved protein YloU, alkaline shock protein (Asp23) family [Ruminococcaceae bacterium YAD3003]|nr:Uncharacterized conserved protein YloU, alkaline shock protein (Asp23) family [Ruminococcaceae bacterium YAD3003]
MDYPDESKNEKTSVESAPVARKTLLSEFRGTLKRFDRSGQASHNQNADSALGFERNADLVLSSEQLTREVLSNIAVIAFVGPSGTGKSTRAIKVARDNNIYYIIDDGLLINGSRIVAGTSAKKAPTKMESVRQAIFVDPTRSSVMRRALIESMPRALMILGTSDSMLSKICDNLWLNQPSMLIRIEDVSTEEERRLARNTRMTEGMHTIPVPSMEIKHEFSGYFSDPFSKLRQRFDRERGVTPLAPDSDRTVVRPTFSSLGSYSISDEAILDLIKIVLKDVPGFAEVTSFKTEKQTFGVMISLDLALYYGYDAQKVLETAQQRVGSAVEEFTSITMNGVNVRANRLIHLPKPPLVEEA